MPRHKACHGWLLVSSFALEVRPDTDPPPSQGGQLVHNAANMLSAQDAAFVSCSLIFGDPQADRPVNNIPAANQKVICHQGDLICKQQSIILAPHLTYGINANEAASFVMSMAGGGAAASKKVAGATKATRQVGGAKAKYFVG